MCVTPRLQANFYEAATFSGMAKSFAVGGDLANLTWLSAGGGGGASVKFFTLIWTTVFGTKHDSTLKNLERSGKTVKEILLSPPWIDEIDLIKTSMQAPTSTEVMVRIKKRAGRNCSDVVCASCVSVV